MRFSLVCDASWVECPGHLDLMNMGRNFTIRVDGRGLAQGAHYSEVMSIIDSQGSYHPGIRKKANSSTGKPLNLNICPEKDLENW